MGPQSPVLMYKAQGIQPDDDASSLLAVDFVLGLQTVAQRKFMLQFGNGCMVSVDSTHGTNQYDFKLVTVMVVDDLGEGIPVAFIISNREDEVVLHEFFAAIKCRLPSEVQFSASHIMTDDAPQYFHAWTSVFGHADKKLCTWHVDRAWRRAIRKHVLEHEQQIEMYHMLRSLLQELDKDDFETYLTAFQEYISSAAPDFAGYFSSYSTRATEWAYCHRLGVQANTNMYVESFHNVLKSAYMERKANRRVDTLLHILLRVARDKVFERLIKLEKNVQSKKQHSITKRHTVVVAVLPAQTSQGWPIPSCSQAGHSYLVMPAKETCSCHLHCHLCDCCPHMYECSCIDFCVHATVCKHIHTVHQLRRAADLSLDNTDTAAPPDDSNESENLASVIPNVVQDGVSTADEISAVRLRLMSKCEQVMGIAGVCDSRKALVCALSHINAAHASLRALTGVPPASITVSRKIPSNKKIDKQLRFFTTKLKRRAVGHTLKKPGLLQVAEAKRNMLSSKSCDTDVLQVESVQDVETVDDIMSMASAVLLPSSIESPFEAVPYCVDTETVCIANDAESGATDTTLPSRTMDLDLSTLQPSQQQGIDHDVEVFLSSS